MIVKTKESTKCIRCTIALGVCLLVYLGSLFAIPNKYEPFNLDNILSDNSYNLLDYLVQESSKNLQRAQKFVNATALKLESQKKSNSNNTNWTEICEEIHNETIYRIVSRITNEFITEIKHETISQITTGHTSLEKLIKDSFHKVNECPSKNNSITINELPTKMNDIRNKISELPMNAIHNKLNEIQTKMNIMHNKINDIPIKFNDLNVKMSSLDNKLNNLLNTTVSIFKDTPIKLNDLIKKVNSLQDIPMKINSLTGNLNELLMKINNLESKVNNLINGILNTTIKRNTLTDLTKKVNSLQDIPMKMNDLTRKVNGLPTKLDTIQVPSKELTSLPNKINNLDEKVNNLTGIVNELNKMPYNINDLLSKLNDVFIKTVVDFKSNLATCNARMYSIEQSLLQLRSGIYQPCIG